MMKPTTWILGIALAGLVAVPGAGCKKEAAAQKAPTYNNVQVNMPKLRAALEKGGQEVQAEMAHVTYGLRYRRYVDALVALDKLKELPSLNDAQKQVVNEISEQVKQVAQKAEEAKPAQ